MPRCVAIQRFVKGISEPCFRRRRRRRPSMAEAPMLEVGGGVSRAEGGGAVWVSGRVQEGTGAAGVVIEHDMAVIGTLAAPVAVMMTGRIVALGGYAEVRRDPAVREGYFGTVLSEAEKAPAVDG